MAVLDLLEATMQIYHNYQHHYSDAVRNDSNGFTTGVVLVSVSEDEFSNPDVFPPNRLRPAYSMQGEILCSIVILLRRLQDTINNPVARDVALIFYFFFFLGWVRVDWADRDFRTRNIC